MDRPTIDQYLLGVACAVADRSDWPGTKVGAVTAKDGQILSTGYNGTPRGYRAKRKDKAELKRFVCHAEENSIVQAAKFGARLDGATFYVTLSPCLSCARMIVNVGASRVVYLKKWDDPMADEAILLLTRLGVRVGPASLFS